jgi:hypothetical protein
MFVHEDQPKVRIAVTNNYNVHKRKENRTETEALIVNFDNM